MCHNSATDSLSFNSNGEVVVHVQARILTYLFVSSLIGLTIGAVVSLAANGFVKGLSYLETVRGFMAQHLISSSLPFSIWPFVWLFVGFGLVVSLKRLGKCDLWQGPADAIYCAHRPDKDMPVRQGIASIFAAFVSLGAGASLGQYGPIVHMGALIGNASRRLVNSSVLSNDVFLGCGVAAAISAGFQAPIAGLIFAHEAVLRHFSAKAVAPIAISSICAASLGDWLFSDSDILSLSAEPLSLIGQVPGLLLGGLAFGFVAVAMMKASLGGMAFIKSLKLPFSVLACGVVLVLGTIGAFVPETVGVGMTALTGVLAGTYATDALFFLLIAKFAAFLVSICFGFVGGFVSPALFLGAISGGLLASVLSAIGFEVSSLTLMVAGMAAVSGTIVGAPISMVMLVFELTESYNFAVSAMLSVVVANLLSHVMFSHSVFDEQLRRRNIDVSKGRGNLVLIERNVCEIMQTSFMTFLPDTPVKTVIEQLSENKQTEAYCVTEEGGYVGKLFLPQLIKAHPKTVSQNCLLAADKVIPAEASIFQAIEIATDFVGEAMAVIDSQSGIIKGIVTEADLFSVYLEAQSDVHKLEHG